MDSADPTQNPPNRNRRSLRLRGCDYTARAGYFVTLCTHNRACLLGTISHGDLRETSCGQIAREEWFKTAALRPYLLLRADEFVLMPNHIHGILWIMDRPAATKEQPRRPITAANPPRGPKSRSIGAILAGFKSATTRRVNEHRPASRLPLWQRNFYEHVIRDGKSLDRIRRYIADNPSRWEFDPNNPNASVPDPEDAWRL